MYKDKNAVKHKCEFSERYVLKVLDKENNQKFYNVMKCNKCLSFKSIPEPGNIAGCILYDMNDEEKRLPVIVGYCKHYYNVSFAKLENVSYENK